jgi:uncharacterized protein YutD
MILNEKVLNSKVLYVFEYYSFGLGHFSIRGTLKNKKINFKIQKPKAEIFGH